MKLRPLAPWLIGVIGGCAVTVPGEHMAGLHDHTPKAAVRHERVSGAPGDSGLLGHVGRDGEWEPVEAASWLHKASLSHGVPSQEP